MVKSECQQIIHNTRGLFVFHYGYDYNSFRVNCQALKSILSEFVKMHKFIPREL